MRPFSPVEVKQMEFCQQLNELRSIFDVCEKAISTAGADELRSTFDVLVRTNKWFQQFTTIETEYLSGLEDDPSVVRGAEEVTERLAELYLIHSHYDVCSTVVVEFGIDDLASLAEVFTDAANRLFCLYDEQLKAGGNV